MLPRYTAPVRLAERAALWASLLSAGVTCTLPRKAVEPSFAGAADFCAPSMSARVTWMVPRWMTLAWAPGRLPDSIRCIFAWGAFMAASAPRLMKAMPTPKATVALNRMALAFMVLSLLSARTLVGQFRSGVIDNYNTKKRDCKGVERNTSEVCTYCNNTLRIISIRNIILDTSIKREETMGHEPRFRASPEPLYQGGRHHPRGPYGLR